MIKGIFIISTLFQEVRVLRLVMKYLYQIFY